MGSRRFALSLARLMREQELPFKEVLNVLQERHLAKEEEK